MIVGTQLVLDVEGVVPHRSVAYLPLHCPGQDPVEEFPLAVPSAWARLGRAAAARDLHALAARLDLTALLDASGVAGVGAPPAVLPLLTLDVAGVEAPVESVFCASMVFVGGGPFEDLAGASPADARADPRLTSSGRRVGFALPGDPGALPIAAPPRFWHAWLLHRAVCAAGCSARLAAAGGFTEVAADPFAGAAPAAYALAAHAALVHRGQVDLAVSFPGFRRLVDLRPRRPR